jgi:DNA-binding transcriptional MerR regulator
MRKAWTTKDAGAITGATTSQLDHWDATDLLWPSLHRPRTDGGSMRLYGIEDLMEMRVLVELRRQGLTLQRIRLGLAYLRFRLPEIRRPMKELVLETDGHTMFAVIGEDEVVDTLAAGQQVVCRVALGPILQELGSLSLGRPCHGPTEEVGAA